MIESGAAAGSRARRARHEALRGGPARAARHAADRSPRCSRGSRSASTRWRSSSTCAPSAARSPSPARWRARSPPVRGVGAPLQGRLVDAFGPRRVLAAARRAPRGGARRDRRRRAEAGAPAAVLVACGVLAGFAIPPTSSVLRSMWPSLLRDRQELIPAAYALDSVLIELIFVLGPLLTAAIATAALTARRADRLGGERDRRDPDVHRAAALARARAGPGRPRAGLLGALGVAGRAHARAHVAARRGRHRHLRGHAARVQRRHGRGVDGRRAAGAVVDRQRVPAGSPTARCATGRR